jgi:DNA-directed RNA polymerase specialized sigma24 family protein
MEIYDQLYKQLKHLVSTVNTCNFIAYEDKKDIIQDTIIAINSKIEDGSLSTDFNEIKGYSFIVLRNFCTAWQRKEIRRETPVAEFWELEDNSITQEEIEYREYLRSMVNMYIQHPKYSSLDRKVCEMVLENNTDKEIREETGLVDKEVGKYRFRIKTRMKYDHKRPLKYIIKNLFNEKIKIPCYSLVDAKNYLSHIHQTKVTSMTTDDYISKDGYYIETLIKRKSHRNGKN